MLCSPEVGIELSYAFDWRPAEAPAPDRTGLRQIISNFSWRRNMRKTLSRITRKLLYGDPIIIVSGLPRSGTSMAMKMLDAGGLSLIEDNIRTADEDNPKGYYEDERVKDLGRTADKTWLREARGKAIKIISHLLKELPPDNNYKVLFIRRNLDEVLASQAKMLVRRGEESATEDATLRELFEADLWRAQYLLKRGSHFDWIELQHRERPSSIAACIATSRRSWRKRGPEVLRS